MILIKLKMLITFDELPDSRFGDCDFHGPLGCCHSTAFSLKIERFGLPLDFQFKTPSVVVQFILSSIRSNLILPGQTLREDRRGSGVDG